MRSTAPRDPPLQDSPMARERSWTASAMRKGRRRSASLLIRSPFSLPLVAKVALHRSLIVFCRKGAAKRLQVGGQLPDAARGQFLSPCRHALGTAGRNRLVDLGRRAAVAPVGVREVGAH